MCPPKNICLMKLNHSALWSEQFKFKLPWYQTLTICYLGFWELWVSLMPGSTWSHAPPEKDSRSQFRICNQPDVFGVSAPVDVDAVALTTCYLRQNQPAAGVSACTSLRLGNTHMTTGKGLATISFLCTRRGSQTPVLQCSSQLSEHRSRSPWGGGSASTVGNQPKHPDFVVDLIWIWRWDPAEITWTCWWAGDLWEPSSLQLQVIVNYSWNQKFKKT